MKFLPYDKPNFLEPAHDHNPADVSNLTDLPPSCSGRLPAEIRELLPAVQEATSIVFASLNRLDDLLSQRLDRLTILSEDGTKPGVGNIQYSEPVYHWYQSQVKNEAQYIVTEALPDWKHKATKVEQECFWCGIMMDPDVAKTGAEAEFARWFSTLKDEVQEWKRIAKGVEVPNFDQAVADLVAVQVRGEAPKVDRISPGTELNDEGMGKIEKVDSGIDF